jgi:hypothetical protein
MPTPETPAQKFARTTRRAALSLGYNNGINSIALRPVGCIPPSECIIVPDNPMLAQRFASTVNGQSLSQLLLQP